MTYWMVQHKSDDATMHIHSNPAKHMLVLLGGIAGCMTLTIQVSADHVIRSQLLRRPPKMIAYHVE